MRRAELEVKIFGGGRVLSTLSDIGNHNVIFVRDYLKQEGLRIMSEDVGANYPRHIQYFPMSGRVRVRNLTARADIVTQEQQFLTRIEKAPVAGDIDLF